MSNHHLISAAIAADAHPIDAYHRSLMEECFQTTLRDVRLHFSTASRAANEAFASLAFTVDNHICVRSAPDASFTWLLAHELTHVLQKRRAAQSRDRRSASLARLEREASAAADGILRGLPAVRLSPDPSAQPRFYGPAGHYYTAFYAALAVGFSVATARSIAFYTQLPDLVSELDAKVAGVDWVHQYAAVYGQSSVVVNRKHTAEDMVRELKLCAMRMDHDKQIQVGLHSLTGGNSDDETKNRIKNLKDCKSAGNMPDFGLAVHALGDSYAHRDFHDETIMYGPPFGHGAEAINHGIRLDKSLDPHDPDKMELRPWLYYRYCEDLYTTLASMCDEKRLLTCQAFQDSAYEVTKNPTDEELQKIMLKTRIRALHSDIEIYDPADDDVPFKTFRDKDLMHMTLSPDLLDQSYRCATAWTGSAVHYTSSVHGSWTDLSKNLIPSFEEIENAFGTITGANRTPEQFMSGFGIQSGF